MTEHEYYSLFTSYGQQIRLKGFNRNICDQGRLNKLKRLINKELSNAAKLIDKELRRLQKGRGDGDSIDQISRSESLSLRKDKIQNLIGKINAEQEISSNEYEGTFYEHKSSFSPAIIGGVLALIAVCATIVGVLL